MLKILGLRPDIPYDYKSVMHYPFSYRDKDGNVKRLIEAKDGKEVKKFCSALNAEFLNAVRNTVL